MKIRILCPAAAIHSRYTSAVCLVQDCPTHPAVVLRLQELLAAHWCPLWSSQTNLGSHTLSPIFLHGDLQWSPLWNLHNATNIYVIPLLNSWKTWLPGWWLMFTGPEERRGKSSKAGLLRRFSWKLQEIRSRLLISFLYWLCNWSTGWPCALQPPAGFSGGWKLCMENQVDLAPSQKHESWHVENNFFAKLLQCMWVALNRTPSYNLKNYPVFVWAHLLALSPLLSEKLPVHASQIIAPRAEWSRPSLGVIPWKHSTKDMFITLFLRTPAIYVRGWLHPTAGSAFQKAWLGIYCYLLESSDWV